MNIAGNRRRNNHMMSYIVEVTAPVDQMTARHEYSIYSLSTNFLFKEQAQEVAKAYREIGCKVRILKETRTVEVVE